MAGGCLGSGMALPAVDTKTLQTDRQTGAVCVSGLPFGWPWASAALWELSYAKQACASVGTEPWVQVFLLNFLKIEPTSFPCVSPFLAEVDILHLLFQLPSLRKTPLWTKALHTLYGHHSYNLRSFRGPIM